MEVGDAITDVRLAYEGSSAQDFDEEAVVSTKYGENPKIV